MQQVIIILSYWPIVDAFTIIDNKKQNDTNKIIWGF